VCDTKFANYALIDGGRSTFWICGDVPIWV
jgi:hypothetical protein